MKTWNELPDEIREKMIEMCHAHGFGDVNRMKEGADNGFRWADTPDGHDFWAGIIYYGKYDRFYSRYPKKDKVSIKKRLAKLEAEVKELRKERDAVSYGCTGVEIRMPEIRKCSNIVTKFPDRVNSEIKINNKWVGNLYAEEEQGADYDGCAVSGHKASLYLNNSNGKWYDEEGNDVSGYFYYKPNDED